MPSSSCVVEGTLTNVAITRCRSCNQSAYDRFSRIADSLSLIGQQRALLRVLRPDFSLCRVYRSENTFEVCRFVEWGYLPGENRRTREIHDHADPLSITRTTGRSFSPDTRLFMRRPRSKFSRFSPSYVAFESPRKFLTRCQ